MPGLSQVFLTTPDLERSRRFYEEALGLQPGRVGETSVSYATEGAELKIQLDFEDETFREYNLTVPGNERGEGGVYVLEQEEDLGEVYRRCVEHGSAEPLTEPRDVEWDGMMFLVRSPAGYVFEIRQN